jgi:hypothetical protein
LLRLSDADVPRVLKQRMLIDSMRRWSGDMVIMAEPIDRVLMSTLDNDASTRLTEAKRHLAAVIAAPGERRLQQRHWEKWVAETDQLFEFSMPEATFQACDDEQITTKHTPDGSPVRCRLIVSQFWSNDPASDFIDYVNPENWPRCSAFWGGMDPLDSKKKLVGEDYDGDYRETVNIFVERLVVPLWIGFRVLPDRSRVWTRFNISRRFYDASVVPVDVDTGMVSAESPTGGRARTLVRATKYLHWRDPGRPDFTMLACDLGWCELMMEMAGKCRAQARPVASSEQPATGDVAITRFVNDVTNECREGVGDHGPHLRSLIGRFTGPSWNAGWINDLLAMSAVTAQRYGRIAGHVRRLGNALRDVDGGERRP